MLHTRARLHSRIIHLCTFARKAADPSRHQFDDNSVESTHSPSVRQCAWRNEAPMFRRHGERGRSKTVLSWVWHTGCRQFRDCLETAIPKTHLTIQNAKKSSGNTFSAHPNPGESDGPGWASRHRLPRSCSVDRRFSAWVTCTSTASSLHYPESARPRLLRKSRWEWLTCACLPLRPACAPRILLRPKRRPTRRRLRRRSRCRQGA